MRFGSVVAWAANSIPVTAITNFAATVKGYVLSDFAAPTAPLNLNSQKITGLASGTANTDAVNKSQMDAADAAALASAKTYADNKTTGTAKTARGTFTGNGTATTFDVVHNLGVSGVGIFLFDSAGSTVLVDAPPKSGATTTTSVITFGTAPVAADGAFSWLAVA